MSSRFTVPHTAMIAAAGKGTRMRPLTDACPKALVEFAGKPLIDHQLDRLQQIGVVRAVVNVHHFADQLEAHLSARDTQPDIQISDERNELLETGGGLVKARSFLGTDPFYIMNVDTVWAGHETALIDLAKVLHNQPNAKAVLLLVKRENCIGLDTAGDFHCQETGQISRRKSGEIASFYYTGIQIFHPDLLQGLPLERFSTNRIWDIALQNNQLYGMELDGFWMHVGDPQSLKQAEKYLDKFDHE